MPRYLNYRRKKRSRVEWVSASDIKKDLVRLIRALNLGNIRTSRVFCYRSFGSKTSARARIWGLPYIWQKALKVKPAYILEVISEKFDHLEDSAKDEILLHELAHIPQNFSGSLVPHFRKGPRKFRNKVKSLIYKYGKSKKI